MKGLDRYIQGLVFLSRQVILRQSIDGKSLPVGAFFIIQKIAPVIHHPDKPAVFCVPEFIQ